MLELVRRCARASSSCRARAARCRRPSAGAGRRRSRGRSRCARLPGAALTSRRAATSATTSKYSHHSAATDRDAERRPRSTTPASTTCSRAGADRDDRLAERDQHDQAVALGEVAGDEPPALGVDEERAAHVEVSASAQSAPCSAPSANAAAPISAAADRGADRQAEDGVAQLRVLAAGDDEQRDLGEAHDRVGDGEDRGAVAERGRHAQRADEQRRHRARRSRAGRCPPRGRRRSSARRSRPTPTTGRRARAGPCARPSHVGSWAISAVHCVIARTKTRSKNSSSGVTRSSSPRRTAVRRGDGAATASLTARGSRRPRCPRRAPRRARRGSRRRGRRAAAPRRPRPRRRRWRGTRRGRRA